MTALLATWKVALSTANSDFEVLKRRSGQLEELLNHLCEFVEYHRQKKRPCIYDIINGLYLITRQIQLWLFIDSVQTFLRRGIISAILDICTFVITLMMVTGFWGHRKGCCHTGYQSRTQIT